MQNPSKSDPSAPAEATKSQAKAKASSTMKKLIIACVICFIFMMGEVVGGILASSIAVLSDAAHMLTDLVGLIISLIFTWLSQRPAKGQYTYGFHRAGVIGALFNIVILWVITGVLVYLAVLRIEEPEHVDGQTMFITAMSGLLVNLVMIKVLHGDHSHGGHDHAHGHGHGHSHATHSHEHPHEKHTHSSRSLLTFWRKQKKEPECITAAHSHHDHDHNHNHNHQTHQTHQNHQHHDHNHNDQPHEHHDHDHNHPTHKHHDHPCSQEKHAESQSKAHQSPEQQDIPHQNTAQDSNPGTVSIKIENAKEKAPHSHSHSHSNSHNHKKHDENVRAAILHVLGDTLQSVGVVIASILIWIWPDDLAIADPICTFIFSAIILMTSKGIIVDCVNVLMEKSPKDYDLISIHDNFMTIPEVLEVHDLHIWNINSNKVSLSVHLRTKNYRQETLELATKLSRSLGITHSTIQVETLADENSLPPAPCEQDIH